jgi:hypothetical protein
MEETIPKGKELQKFWTYHLPGNNDLFILTKIAPLK